MIRIRLYLKKKVIIDVGVSVYNFRIFS